MNKIRMNAIVCGAAILAAVLALASCQPEPNPLVGSWADNQGSTITLLADNTFLVKVQDVTTEGTYSVLLNVITFTTKDGLQRVTEWDIRGNILYLTWTDDQRVSTPLSLYKIRN